MKTGRPLLFKTLKELTDKADDYFDTIPMEEWTYTGLALHLNTSRETLDDYKARPEFSDSLKKYSDMVTNSYEVDLKKHGRAGTIFALKNYGWTDKVETVNTNTNANIEIKDKSEIKRVMEELDKC